MGTSKGNYGRKMYLDPAWKKAVSDGLKLKRIEVEKKCPCGKTFVVERKIKRNGKVSILKREKRFCSRSCASSRTENREEINKKISKSLTKKELMGKACLFYRKKCSFDFGISSFPEEFDFNLIEEHGWYKPSNRGNNINGVSRDHIVSIKFGWENNILPEIIKHPANCQLMLHGENISKGSKSQMTFEELRVKIKEWDEKYKIT